MSDVNKTSPQFFDAKGDATSTQSAKAARRGLRKEAKEEKQYKRMPKAIQPRNEKQARYIESLKNNDLTFGIGPAGVGKTYVPARVYGEMLASGAIKKLYVARPNVAKKTHKNGYLPGTLEDKTEPWLVPIFEGLKESMGPNEFTRFRKEKMIEEVPFEFIQGRTFKDAACIVDEAENLDLDDLYITLTRQGEGLSMCLCGDIFQSRIPDSGLAAVIEMGREDEHESEGVIEFDENDVVRSRQAAQWVKSFTKRPHLLGFFNASKSHVNLHPATNCDIDASVTFADNPPDFLKEA
jgi:phosphate starvation-inducible PhoH-like protein